MKPITQKTNGEIMDDIKTITDIVGKKTLVDVLMLFEPDREYYHIKDFYVGICSYLNFIQNKKCQDYLASLKI